VISCSHTCAFACLRSRAFTPSRPQSRARCRAAVLPWHAHHVSLTCHQLILSRVLAQCHACHAQFRGEFCYSTTCADCGQRSASSANKYPFYELELNVRPTLHAALAEYIQKDELCGDNQYLCEVCNGKRDATRQIELLALPPVLTLQLLRFVYDVETNSKKKARALHLNTPIEMRCANCMRGLNMPPAEAEGAAIQSLIDAVASSTSGDAHVLTATLHPRCTHAARRSPRPSSSPRC